jgi:hypothetical protein
LKMRLKIRTPALFTRSRRFSCKNGEKATNKA